MRVFKQAVNLSKQAKKIEKELSDINPFNAKTKRENAVQLLNKWFPAMEDFEAEIKKYQKSINILSKENDGLTAEVKAAEDGRFARFLETKKIESQLLEIRKFVDFIPEDLRRQLKEDYKQSKSSPNRGYSRE